jgi:sulfite reductase (NADPH) hemoprotein beta-component
VAGAVLRGPGEPPELRIERAPSAAALARFRAGQVAPQRQAGWSAVTVRLPQGDVTAAQLRVLAELALAHADGAVRLGNAGHLHLRWVPDEELAALHAGLAAAGLGSDGAGSAADAVVCPGADSCALAVTRTRGLGRRIEAAVRERLGADGTAAALPVHASGCPNGCSQHHLAAIGLQGSLRKLGDQAVPQCFVMLGGGVDEAGASFGKLAAKVPGRRVPEAVAALAALYLAERREGEAAGAYFRRAFDRARALLAPLEAMRPDDLVPEDLEDAPEPEPEAGQAA